MKYNHAFTIAFSVDTDNEGDKVTENELLIALLNKVKDLVEEANIIQCAGLPFDTYEN